MKNSSVVSPRSCPPPGFIRSKVPRALLCSAAIWASASLLVTACTDRQPPTSAPGEPSQVVRGYPEPGGCGVTEVIEEYPTDSTETILVTFTSASPDNCYPNLVQWGIDMADPMESDTPQGQSYWLARAPHYTLDAANMPSPSHFATNFYTPPYSLIEIDPPARSVEFHYSRRLQAPARWPCTGCAYVFADSMQVRAMQRIPGTISYFIYDRKVLYSNLTTTDGPFNVWTHVKLNGGGGDNIQWVWFDGHLALDDLKITRVLVTCTPRPRRGEEVVCRVTSPNLNVTRWEFQPDSAALPPVQDTTTSKEWRGVAALPGQAIAYHDGRERHPSDTACTV